MTGEIEALGEKYPSATLSITNFTWNDLKLNTGPHGESLAANRLGGTWSCLNLNKN
jgi:hypothetical protein